MQNASVIACCRC